MNNKFYGNNNRLVIISTIAIITIFTIAMMLTMPAIAVDDNGNSTIKGHNNLTTSKGTSTANKEDAYNHPADDLYIPAPEEIEKFKKSPLYKFMDKILPKDTHDQSSTQKRDNPKRNKKGHGCKFNKELYDSV